MLHEGIATMVKVVLLGDGYIPFSLMMQKVMKNDFVFLSSNSKLESAAAAKSFQSCLTLCDPIDGSPPGSTVLGILQARTLEWVAISFSNAWKWKVKVKSESVVAQLCPTLSDPMDYSPPGSSVHGIFQARVLEWGAIAFSELEPSKWQKVVALFISFENDFCT